MPDAAISFSSSQSALPEIRSSTMFNKLYITPPFVFKVRILTSVLLQWDSVDKSAIQERKIRVNWLPALQENGQPNPAVTPVRHSLANGVRTLDVGSRRRISLRC